ncbi:MAG: carboxypeptidase-like regulatory domain-containing protein, partial [Terracidiphilus sp.]
MAIIVAACSIMSANAQLTATLSGTVTDPSGAALPGAKITLINEASHEVRPATANADGYFTYPFLNPGTYDLKIEAPGFKSLERSGIKLNLEDNIAVPKLALAVGSAQETVTVAASNEIIPTESGQRADVLEADDIQNLAISGRAVLELMKTLPGVVQVPASTQGGGGNGPAFNALNVGAATSPDASSLNANGEIQRGGMSQFLDGVDVIDPGSMTNTISTVNPDMVQEVSVQTSNFGANVAHGPVVVSSISKSGGDHYHGEGYFYARNDALDANDWLDNHTGTPRGDAHYYYPGGNAGGPIPFTHKKVRVWGGYEKFLQNLGNASELESFIPTSDMMGGNFTATTANTAFCSQTGGINSTNTNGCNDLTGTILPDGSVVGVGTRAPGMIPSQFIDPGAQALAKIWPAANLDPSTTPGGFNYKATIPSEHDGWIYRLRADYDLDANNIFYLAYQQGYDTSVAGPHAFWTPANSIPTPGGDATAFSQTKVLAGHFVHIFGPTLTNEFIASWGYGNFNDFAPPNPSAFYRTTLDYPGTYGTVFNTGAKIIPAYSSAGSWTFPDFSQWDVTDNGGGLAFRKEIPAFTDNLTKVWKSHTFSVGFFTETVGDYTAVADNGSQENGALNSFSGQYNNILTGNAVGSPNNPTANFLMGIVTSYTEESYSPQNNMAYQVHAFYFNDVWKANRRLTLEYGARFDHIGHWYDRSNYGVPVFIPGDVMLDYNAGRLNPGLRYHGLDPGVPDSGVPNEPLWVEPRVGFNYDLFGHGKTILRGGWGEYRMTVADDEPEVANIYAQPVQTYNLPGQSSVFLSQFGDLKASGPTGVNGSVQAYTYDDHSVPDSTNYSFTISQEVKWNSLVELAYVGSKADRLNDPGGDNNQGAGVSSGFIDQNKTPVGAFFKADPVTGCTAPNPEDLSGPGCPSNQEADYHPYGFAYGDNPIYVEQSHGYANYNSLQATWVKRGQRLTYNLNYTWSKALGTSLWADPFDIKHDYGVLSTDRPEVLNTSYTYNFGNPVHDNKLL